MKLIKYNSFLNKYFYCFNRKLSNSNSGRAIKILGIETSCDDTGVAIVDSDGNILGDAIHSQLDVHLKYGGIIPPIAREMHRANITDICEKALRTAGLKLRDVDAIATTMKPGLALSLMIGRNFGKYLSRVGNKPFIPIHHMEAHALTGRMVEKVDFPFLVLLMSGGHCLLALVKNVTDFCVLGSTLDDAPGEALDKIARRLKMMNIPEYSGKNGGQAIELAASKATNPLKFQFPVSMVHHRDCNFSFAGLKNSIVTLINRQELNSKIIGNETIPDIENICAGFQLAMAKQIAIKTKRAMIFLNEKNLIQHDQRTLVVSGGVACNNFIAKALGIICNEMDYRLVRPPPQLCTDNGIMIAWNGIERWNVNAGVLKDPVEIENVKLEARAPLGEDWSHLVKDLDIKCTHLKTKELYL